MQNLGRFLLGILRNEIKYYEKQRPQCHSWKFFKEAVCSQAPLIVECPCIMVLHEQMSWTRVGMLYRCEDDNTI